ncbi:hypothetical protein ACVFYP_21185 [Roseomonas sp. F4]
MNNPDHRPVSWDLDMLMPELPAQGRWRGGPVNHRLSPGHETLTWHPGEGDRLIRPQDGVGTLRLEDTDRTLAQILEAIVTEPGSATPRLMLGEIALQGVKGSIRLGEETIRFAGIQRVMIGGYSAYPTRGD